MAGEEAGDNMETITPTPELRARFEAAGGKPVYVRRMFGRIAGVYDLMNRLMSAGLDRRWRTFTVRQIALGPGQSGLDIGTGTGDLAIALAGQSAPNSHVIGVDFTPEMLARGREKIQRLGLAERVELRQDDGEHLNFPSAAFDAVCSAFVVRNLTDPRHGFEEMLRVTKPGGHIALFDFYFGRLVPLLGTLIGKAFDAYSYLPSSVTVFPSAPALKRVMETAGWCDVRYYYLLGGVVAVHVGTKPSVNGSQD
jgi:demethylmenaquinone methyltransferase/2-methoxy-6-polyprenyl-1,4-benzoquinol methylase